MVLLVAVMILGCNETDINAAAVDVPKTETGINAAEVKTEDIKETRTAAVDVANAVEDNKTKQDETKPEEAVREETTVERKADKADTAGPAIREEGYYYDKESVILYLHTYGRLPGNFITKKDAKALGWEGGSVEQVAPDMAIGGDYYGNYEGQLPKVAGREYHECDIDTHGYKNRGSRRLIYSSDGAYYYTGDHYESFEEMIVTDDDKVEFKR